MDEIVKKVINEVLDGSAQTTAYKSKFMAFINDYLSNKHSRKQIEDLILSITLNKKNEN